MDPVETKFGVKKLTKTTEDGKAQTFSFTLAAKEGTPMPEGTTASVTFEAGTTGEQTIPFGKIKYTAAGTYEYTITEDAKGAGWTTEGSPVTVTVEITDNGDGTLSAKVTGGTITNEYNAKVVVDPKDTKAPFGKKNLIKTTEDGQAQTFSFTLEAEEGTAPDGETARTVPMPEGTTGTVTYEAGKTGEQIIPFAEITYTAAGTYKYTITETEKGAGWTTTGSPATVTVEVTDNGDGTLSAKVTGGTITNEYNAKVVVDPKDTKTTFGIKNLIKTTEDGQAQTFSFTLEAVDGAPMPESATGAKGEVTYEAGKTGEQIIPFDEITYTAAGTYKYTITETEKGAGWTTTGNTATVTVEVTDNGDGTLSAKVTGGTIENKYDAEVTVDPKDTKTTFGKKNLVKTTEDGKGHTFSFTLAAATEGAPMPEGTTGAVTYEADKTGEQIIPFNEITYTAAGTYKYTITEDTTEYTTENGWTVTNNGGTVTVEVTDNGDGTLSAKVTTLTIENSYTPKDVDVDPTDTETTFGIKNFTSTTEASAHTFKFTLEANTEGAPMPASATAEVTYAAGATGEQVIPFGIITYKKIGEYKYTITEDTTEYTAEKGWTTGGPITVTVTVTDNGKGQLEAKVTGGTIENSQRDVWTELTVRKTWLDNDNAQGLRPTVIRVYLYANGERVNFVTLNAANGWDRTVRNLPVYDENGERIRYTWREQDIPGYTLIQTFTRGNVTRFVNAIDEYGTPLGLGEVFINVGECFE